MSARSKSRFTTAQTAWIALAIFAGWLVFLFVPAPRPAKPPSSNELPPVAAQSKLESVGLTNNPDWQGLPDYFSIWAGSVAWEGDHTYFAYWNPGSYSYSYFFEAIRKDGHIRFRSLPANPRDVNLVLDDDELADYSKSRKGDSADHPFVFATKLPQAATPSVLAAPGGGQLEKPVEKVELNSGAQPITPPPVKLPDAKPKK